RCRSHLAGRRHSSTADRSSSQSAMATGAPSGSVGTRRCDIILSGCRDRRPGDQASKGIIMRIAFLGLGRMSSHMARNLEAEGYQVTCFDVVQDAVDAAERDGLATGASANETVKEADVVITMFPAGQHVLGAYRDGLLDSAPANTLFIDSSTI